MNIYWYMTEKNIQIRTEDDGNTCIFKKNEQILRIIKTSTFWKKLKIKLIDTDIFTLIVNLKNIDKVL